MPSTHKLPAVRVDAPATDGGDVHDGDDRRRWPPAPECQHEPGDHLGSAHDHEDAREGRVFGVDAGGGEVDRPAPTDARPANWARSAVVTRSVRPTVSAVSIVIAPLSSRSLVVA